MLSYCHKLFAFAHTETVCLCLSDSCSDHWGPAVVWQQHQTGGEGQCVWRHPQDKDQEGKQPLLWRGTLNSYTVRRYTIQFYNKMFYNTFLMESKFVLFDLIGLAFNIFSFCLSSLKLCFFFIIFDFCRCFSTMFTCCHQICLISTSASGSVHEYWFWDPIICQYV